jgi:3-oxoacyl-[acyl-carrier-protein] synthase III
MGIKILGTGSYLPEKVVTNEDIAKTLDTTDEWIYSHTGIRSRHVAGEGESTSTMAAEAGRRALEAAGLDAGALEDDVDALAGDALPEAPDRRYVGLSDVAEHPELVV